MSSALGECDVVYVAVDVPTDDQGAKRSAADQGHGRAGSRRNSTAKALLVILSQVPPGYTRALPVPAERLYYQVETLVFGRAVERATKPERFIVGCADPRQPIAPALKAFLESFSCPILPMAYESAELAKISINFCLVASIAVANTLAEVCERVGANWSDIAPALKLDKRIGQGAYLSPGLGIAGGNLERDLRTIVQIGEAKKTDVGVVKAWLANSAHRKDWTWQVLQDHALMSDPAATIAVLGLAYKENTHSTKNSPSLALLEHLRGRAGESARSCGAGHGRAVDHRRGRSSCGGDRRRCAGDRDAMAAIPRASPGGSRPRHEGADGARSLSRARRRKPARRRA